MLLWFFKVFAEKNESAEVINMKVDGPILVLLRSRLHIDIFANITVLSTICISQSSDTTVPIFLVGFICEALIEFWYALVFYQSSHELCSSQKAV